MSASLIVSTVEPQPLFVRDSLGITRVGTNTLAWTGYLGWSGLHGSFASWAGEWSSYCWSLAGGVMVAIAGLEAGASPMS